MAVTDRHFANLKEHNIEELIAGYADDAIILTNLCERPLEGKEDIRRYCGGLIQRAGEKIDAFTDPAAKITVKEAVAELSCIGYINSRQGRHLMSGGPVCFFSILIILEIRLSKSFRTVV